MHLHQHQGATKNSTNLNATKHPQVLIPFLSNVTLIFSAATVDEPGKVSLYSNLKVVRTYLASIQIDCSSHPQGTNEGALVIHRAQMKVVRSTLFIALQKSLSVSESVG